MWFRIIMIGMLSFTAISFITFQGIEVVRAFVDIFNNQK